MSAVQSNPIITWVAPEPAKSGKSVKVYVSHESWDTDVVHYAWIPVNMAPRKFDAVEADTVKLGDIESEYTDPVTGEIKTRKAQRQVSFYGTIALVDGPTVAPTTWVDKRTQRNPESF